MIPVILVLIDNYSPKLSALSAMVFTVAAASDALDGYLARRMSLVTVLGKFLDPLADKLIVLATLVWLVGALRAPAWLVVVLMARELAITGLRAIAASQGLVIAAGAGGKAKTALQLTGIVFLLIHFPYPLLFVDVVIDFHQVGMWFLYASLVLSILSAFEYFKFFVRAASEQARELEAQGITRGALKGAAQVRRSKIRQIKAARRQSKLADRKARIAAKRERRAKKARSGPKKND
ncbi:MAG: CDP-diacylglycerol--glycerol-3-phosphate 3-phosphatidyltransferase [Deltaproteobacteria bacterium]|nr:CDP-diacylglycerol--glycerol-3-phosphate 3-phosphatidyltransferase [Deltaproteobacteria bacterium]